MGFFDSIGDIFSGAADAVADVAESVGDAAGDLLDSAADVGGDLVSVVQDNPELAALTATFFGAPPGVSLALGGGGGDVWGGEASGFDWGSLIKIGAKILLDNASRQGDAVTKKVIKTVPRVLKAANKKGAVTAKEVGSILKDVLGRSRSRRFASFSGVQAGADNLLNSAANGYGDTVDSINTNANSYLDSGAAGASRFENNVYGFTSDSIGGATSAGVETQDIALTDILSALTSGGETADAIGGIVSSYGDELLFTAANTLVESHNLVQAEVVNTLAGVDELYSNLSAQLIDASTASINNALSAAADTQELVGASTLSLLDDVHALTSDIVNRGDPLNAFLNSFGGDLQSFGEENFKGPLDGLPLGFLETFEKAAIDSDESGGAEREENTADIAAGKSRKKYTRDNVQELYNDVLPNSPIPRLIGRMLIAVLTAVQIPAKISSAQAEIWLQEYSRENPWQLLDLNSLAAALRYQLIDRDKFISEAAAHGIAPDDAALLVSMNENLPTTDEALHLWLRGLYSDDELQWVMTALGWSEQTIERWKEAAYFIPPAQDLIQMAVREAFSPDAVEQFGLHEDLPPEFVEWGAKQGISEDWARNYWAAHWRLPSAEQGFEMNHRGVITNEELALLLRTLDYSPPWRDKLLAISYNPLTRVDVRRMYQLGVLDRDQVKRAYLDIGYSEENAEALTLFTEQLKTKGIDEDSLELKGLTRAAILNFYDDGVVNRGRAFELLGAMGLSEDTSELYLKNVDFDNERATRKAATDLALAKFRAGVTTFEQAQGDLATLGLTPKEQEKALTAVRSVQAGNIKQPTRADLNNFIKAGLITEAEYRAEMSTLGYSEKWTTLYLKLALKGEDLDA